MRHSEKKRFPLSYSIFRFCVVIEYSITIMFEKFFEGSQEVKKFCKYFERGPQQYLILLLQFSCFHFTTACPFGFFGLNCSRECHCQNGGVCDTLDGHCTCTPGWMGTLCQERKYIFINTTVWTPTAFNKRSIHLLSIYSHCSCYSFGSFYRTLRNSMK